MVSTNYTQTLTKAVDQLSDPTSLKGLFHQHQDGNPLPSGKVLEEIVDLSRAIIFPGFFGKSKINKHTIRYHIGMAVERMSKLLEDQILAGLCFSCPNSGKGENLPCKIKAKEMAFKLIEELPEIRRVLATDVEAAFNGDPAATIGHHFTIDHGTGVVIGATCIIGNNVKLYQGVTLGAKSFPLDENGNPIKGIPRHPILEDDVIVYSNATILGRITIGRGSIVGANIWVTEDLEPYSKVYKRN